MNVLITGSNGFVGRHLAELLRRRGHIVHGIDIHEDSWASWMRYAKVDITKFEDLWSVVSSNSVEVVYHLAAVANPRIADSNPLLGISVNVLGPCNLLECARLRPSLKVLFVGSSEQYRTKSGNHIRYEEHDEQRAHNIYGAAKIAFETIGREYHRRFGVNVYFTRSFNHTGPGQPAEYVLASFAEQVRAIARGDQQPVIKVGNIKATRDFTDVRDVVCAYEAVVEHGVCGETYNVCSGRVYSLKDLLNQMLRKAGILDRVTIETDPKLLRDDDPDAVFGDNSKLVLHTGWKATRQIETTVQELVAVDSE